MRKLAIVSMAIGDDFQKMSEVSFPTFRDYARKLGAEFQVLPGGCFPKDHIHWEKLSIGRLLENFDRILWIDCDAIINPKAPSIFDIVPEEAFGAFNEGAEINRSSSIAELTEFYGKGQRAYPGTRYFNAGIMVVGRCHEKVFSTPEHLIGGGMPEQDYVNAQVSFMDIPFYDLTYRWNAFNSYHTKESRATCNIIHYAGWPKVDNWLQNMTHEMKEDLNRWI